jgi:hypothetical protein
VLHLQGFFSGTYNQIGGKVKSKSSEIGTIDGKWSGTMEFKPARGDKRVLFDVAKDGAKVAAKVVSPEGEQEPNESRRLWAALTDALGRRDQDAAQDAKNAVEERERELRKKREAEGKQHVPRFFEQRNGRWEPKLRFAACIFHKRQSLTHEQATGGPAGGREGRRGVHLALSAADTDVEHIDQRCWVYVQSIHDVAQRF